MDDDNFQSTSINIFYMEKFTLTIQAKGAEH